MDNLSRDLNSKKIDHNIILLNCSIKNNFFKFNNKFDDCPIFIVKNYDKESYVYLNHKKNYFRLAKFSKDTNIKLLWVKLLEKNQTSYQLSIDASNYNKLKYFTGLEPKILSYMQNKIILEFENFYNNKQINFLINFF